MSDLLESGVEVSDSYALNDGLYNLSRVYCLSIPHLLKLHPFIQGLTSCNELAAAMATSLVEDIAGKQRFARQIIAENVAHFDETSLICCLSKKRRHRSSGAQG